MIKYTDEGLEIEADPRHAEIVVRELGVGEGKESPTPGVKEARFRARKTGEDEQEKEEEDEDKEDPEEQEMSRADATRYRAIVAWGGEFFGSEWRQHGLAQEGWETPAPTGRWDFVQIGVQRGADGH